MTRLCHISQISEKRLRSCAEELKVGQKVRVKILNTNDGKISLSIKQAVDDDAKEAYETTDVTESLSSESIGTNLGALLANFKF